VLDITVGDFPTSSEYVDVRLPVVVNGIDWAQHDYKLYWTGERALYVDELRLVDPRGEWLHALAFDSTSVAAGRVAAKFRDETPVMQRIDDFYLFDEPTGVDLANANLYKRIIYDLPSDSVYPKHQLSILGSYGSPNSWDYGHWYFDTWMHYADDQDINYFIFDNYINGCCLNASSAVYDTQYVQFQVDNSVIPHLQSARIRADAMISNPGFWVTLPTFSWHNCTAKDSLQRCIQWRKGSRALGATELRMLVNVCLSYGATGIGYWKYTSEYLSCPPEESELQAPKEEQPMLVASDGSSISYVADNSELVDCDACTTYTCPTPPPFRNECPITIVGGAAQKTPLWDSLRSINMYLDSMAAFFLNADWLSSGYDHHSFLSLSGSFIDSAKSVSGWYHPYIQVAFFDYSGTKYQDGTYALVVNRRCDDGSWTRVDTQTVRLYMPAEGAYDVYDVYEDSTYRIWDSAGIVQWDRHLQPGEATLIRLDVVKDTWAGTPDTSSSLWQWPVHSTINVVGDLSIDSGVTFSAAGVTLKCRANSDSLSSGNDTTKVEIIVGGTLRIGAQTGPVTTISGDSCWYGIRTTPTGHLFVDRAHIKRAWAGIKIMSEKPDTVKRTVLDSCFMYGIYSASNTAQFANDTIRYSENGYGIYLDQTYDTSDVKNCYFEDVKNPIYLNLRSSPDIEGCEFYGNEYGGVSGQPGVFVGQYCDPVISGCEFTDVPKGITIGRLADVQIYSCVFDSEDRDIRVAPFMYGAIYAPDVCQGIEVRNCCFMATEEFSVYRGNASIDLGTVSDSGLNNFYVDSVWVVWEGSGKWIQNPQYSICNDGFSGTVQAEYCYFHPSADNTGSVDTIPSLGSPVSGICGATGGITKLAEVGTSQDSSLAEVTLDQNHPNPFNPVTSISFTLPEKSRVTLSIFNILGQEVVTLLDRDMDAGYHDIEWSGKDQRGVTCASGVYLYRLRVEDFAETRKMILLK